MSTENPYTPPEAEISYEDAGELASRWKRLFGVLIDGILIAAVTVPVMIMTGYIDRAASGSQSLIEMLMLGLLSVVIFFVLNGYLLKAKGQTVGKLLLSTQIVSVDNERLLPLGKLIALRYLPVWLAGYIPFLGAFVGLFNALAIFGSEKRCLHDHIAGTKVINYRTQSGPRY